MSPFATAAREGSASGSIFTNHWSRTWETKVGAKNVCALGDWKRCRGVYVFSRSRAASVEMPADPNDWKKVVKSCRCMQWMPRVSGQPLGCHQSAQSGSEHARTQDFEHSRGLSMRACLWERSENRAEVAHQGLDDFAAAL